MANYNHKQFTAEFNRLRGGVGIFADPKPPRIQQHQADPENPYENIHIGLFRSSVKDSLGRDREYLFYIPKTMKTSGSTMFVFADKGQTSEGFYNSYNWPEVLEKYEVTVAFLAPEGDWDKEDPGVELDWFMDVYSEMMDLEYYASNQDAQYTLGFGSGAYMSTLFSILYGSKFTAFASAGETGFTDELFDILRSLPSDGDPHTMKSECPIPAWIMDGSESGRKVADFLKKANNSLEEGLSNDVAKVWYPAQKPGELHLNTQRINQVWYSDCIPLQGNELIDRMVKFVVAFKRWGGWGNNHLRLTKSPEDMGFVHKEIIVDGRKRIFDVFEPTVYKQKKEEKYPLLIAIHGYSCSGPFFAENSCWEAIAEERGFLCVFPTAYPWMRKNQPGRPPRNSVPTPTWNTTYNNPDTDAPDELNYFRALLETVREEYPVDNTRIYVSGHSNGAAMTQYLMRYMPEEFAAFAPVGGMEASFTGKAEPFPNSIIRPVWYTMGQYDVGEGWKFEEGCGNYITVKNACDNNGVDLEKASKYVNGIYHNIVAYTGDRSMPLVRYTGIENWPHTVTPEHDLMLWDEFLCKFRRNPDGSIEYLG